MSKALRIKVTEPLSNHGPFVEFSVRLPRETYDNLSYVCNTYCDMTLSELCSDILNTWSETF